MTIDFFFLGRRTYEGLDEQPMMDVDVDDDYDNQFMACDDKDPNQNNQKRMRQTPRTNI